MRKQKKLRRRGDVIVRDDGLVLLTLLVLVGIVVYVAVGLLKPGTPAAVVPNNTLPAWSPDGENIAFVSDRDGNSEIYLVNVNSLEGTRITANSAIDKMPSWTPGGELIAFCSNRDGQKGLDIYGLDPATGQVTRLSFTKTGWDCDTSWTPTTGETESKDIVFSSDRDGNTEIYKMNIDTLAVTRLTFRERTKDEKPTISPDGTRIAFQSFVERNWEIFVMEADGSSIKRLTFNPEDDLQPAWSPKGDKIAFTTSRDKNAEIYTMNPDGSNKKNISNNESEDGYPSWSPDGARIAFQSDRTGRWQIWTMRSTDGTEQKQITGLE